jgi:hypothetical protein
MNRLTTVVTASWKSTNLYGIVKNWALLKAESSVTRKLNTQMAFAGHLSHNEGLIKVQLLWDCSYLLRLEFERSWEELMVPACF